MDKQPPRPLSNPVASPRSGHSLHPQDSSENKLLPEVEDGFSRFLHAIIHFAVRVMAILMVVVILWSVVGIGWQFYQRLIAPPFLLLSVNDILALFGAFLVVLIAIELFINISLYIKRDALPLKMVVAIGLMATVRKAIMLDVTEVAWTSLLALAAIIVALGLAYWLVSYKPQPQKNDDYR